MSLALADRSGVDSETVTTCDRTFVGWQGVRFELPPDWSVSGFSMDRDNGYLRVDAPGNSALTVQVRWSDASRPASGSRSLHTVLTDLYRGARRLPRPPVDRPDLKASLEKVLKEAAKKAKKAKASFESSLKPERTEGEAGERSAINFSWAGGGRGQGKIWYCERCHRLLIAQVVGLGKDGQAIATIASQLFSSLRDHADDGYDVWSLYDLEIGVPTDFRLDSQKLLSGYLHLAFSRGAEKLVIDRWGLANVTLKRFTLAEWFGNHALLRVRRMQQSDDEGPGGHALVRYTGRLPLVSVVRALIDSRGRVRRLPRRFDAGVWQCEQSNRIFSLQAVTSVRSGDLWAEVAQRCVCH